MDYHYRPDNQGSDNLMGQPSNPQRLSYYEENDVGRLEAAFAPQQTEIRTVMQPAGTVFGPVPSNTYANYIPQVAYPPLYHSSPQHVQIPGAGVSGCSGVQSPSAGEQWYGLVEGVRKTADDRSQVASPSMPAEALSRGPKTAVIRGSWIS
jgi:hypothetical protein